MSHRLSVVIIALISSFFFCLTALAGEADDDDTTADLHPAYTVSDNITMVSKTNIQYDKPRIVIRATYPVLQSEIDNPTIVTFSQLVADIIKEAANKFKTQAIERRPYQENMPKTHVRNELTIDYAASIIHSKQHPIISIRFSVHGMIAGLAHPYHYHRVLTYDLETGQPIQLTDLFSPDADYLNVLSEYARKILLRRLSEKDMVMKGTEPLPDNFMNWNIRSDGLLITFDEYQVAPYYLGAQTVRVPFTSLKNVLSPVSPIAYCISHKRKCRNNSLLTGGFIDQAVNTGHRRLNPILSKL